MKAPPATPGDSASGSPDDDPRAGGDQLARSGRGRRRAGAVETSAPIRLSLSRGSPTLVAASRSRIAASTASRCSAGAMARRMAVHFCPALTVISLTTSLTNRSNSGVPGRRVGAEQRGVEAVLLGDEPDALALDDGVRAKLERGRGRAGEADHVLPGQMVEQVADAADDQLHRARRQQAAVDHHPERGFAQIGGRAGRLDDRRHAREQGRGELLEHPPDREVEGVDVHRRALQRRVDVLADEACRSSTAARARRRAGHARRAVRGGPWTRRRTACRRRPRCRSSRPCGSRRSGS